VLDTLRKNVRRLSWTLWLVIAAFIILYIPDLVSGGAANVIARVDGDPIYAADFQRTLNEQINYYRSMSQGQLPDDFVQQLQLERVVLEQMIRQRLILASAHDQGFAVAPQEIKDRIMEYPVFRDSDGRWVGDSQYRDILASNGLDTVEFEQQVIDDLMVERLTGLLTEGITVTDEEVREIYERRNEKVAFDFVQVRPGAYQLEVRDAITDEDLQSHYAADPDAYRLPEQRRVSYALIDTEAIRDLVEIDEEAARAAYDTRVAEYTVPEQIKVRQILLRVPPGTADDVRTEIRDAAEAAAARLESGEDFAAVAQEVSDDPSASVGGDLGWVTRGRQVEGFDEVAFALEPGETSEIFETSFGYTILRVDEKRDEQVQPFEQVRAQIEQELAWDRAESDAQAQADAIRREVLRGTELESIAESNGLEVEESPLFSQADGFGSFTAPEFTGRAFSLGEGRVAEPVRVRRGYLVFRVDEIVAPHTPELGEVRERVRRDVVDARAAERAEEVAAEYVRRLRDGETLETIATEASTTVETADELSREDFVPALGRSAELLDEAFELQSGEVGGPVDVNGRFVVFRLTSHVQPDWSLFEETSEQLRQQELNQRRNQMFEAFVQSLRGRYRVDIYDDVLARFTTT
jgi:peptidyl-prolyl cis-trans isomerase D